MKKSKALVFLWWGTLFLHCAPDFERENNPKLMRTIDSLSIVRYSQAQDSLRNLCIENKEQEIDRMVDSLVRRGLRDYERLRRTEKSPK
jgi:hypothetical protein